MEAMALGLHESSLDGFYHLCRTLCVKDIAHYDAYDEAFLAYFKDVHTDALELTEQLAGVAARSAGARRASPTSSAQALQRARPRQAARAVRAAAARSRRSATTAATAGSAPAARRRSAPAARTRPACASAAAAGAARWRSPIERRFASTAATSCSTCARSTSRCAACAGSVARAPIEELDLDETIDKTCKNAGELEVVFRPPRRNRVKVVLLMDVGGSMDPHSELMSRLFTAASRIGPVREVPQLLLPQLRLQLGLRGRAVPQGRAGRRSAREQRSRREARHRRRRADAPGRAARSGRLDVSLRADRARRASSGCAGSRTTSAARRGSTPSPIGSGPGTTIEVIASVFADVAAHARRPRATPCATSCAAARSRASAIRRSGSRRWAETLSPRSS